MTKKIILVIEDEGDIRENIEEILLLEDFRVMTAENGRLGVELAKKQIPDLVICDIMMPELDGYDVLTELQKEPVTAAIPFIFLTAKADRKNWRRGIELGADDYLTKPFTPKELLKAISTRFAKQNTITKTYKQQVEQLGTGIDYLIHYDGLTQLPNRFWLQQRFARLQTQLDRQKIHLPLLGLSLDQFNWVSSTFGNEYSNSLLKAVAARLKSQLGDLDNRIDTIARDRADRFIILLKTIEQEQDAQQIAQKIIALFSSPFTIDERQLWLTVSIGIALDYGDRSSSNLDHLINHAHIAIYNSKQQGGNEYQIYTPQMKANASEAIILQGGLKQALEQEQFQIYYQPIVEIERGKIIAVEALLRWHDPERGLISPGKFIPIAEKTGLIIPIGEWVLRQVCLQIKIWQTQGFDMSQVSVNVSPRQFNDPLLEEKIIQILRETGLEPSCLDLELTESMLVQNVGAVQEILDSLKSLGISLSIDDFGTGYSCLNNLQKFPFDNLKIDRCFVHNLVINPGNIAIVNAIISMAHSLNLKVIAEGVETESELMFLNNQHCDLIQGYLYSPPLPLKEFESLLKSDKRLPQTFPSPLNVFPSSG